MRLSNIEGLLQVLVNSSHVNRIEYQSRGDNTGFFTQTVLPTASTTRDGPAFAGNSSLTAHTAFASDFLGHIDQLKTLCDSHAGLKSALCELQQIVTTQNNATADESFSNEHPLPDGGRIHDLPMPPQSLVLQILRDIKCMI